MRTLYILCFLVCLLLLQNADAQDIVLLRSGEEIKAKVIEVSSTEIKYKRFDNQEGPTYVLKKSEIFMITYEGGRKEIFKEQESTPATSPQTQTRDLPKSSFHINPLGLLQFGPVFMYESKMGTGNAYLAPYIRLGYLGVLTHLDWDADYVSPLNLGIGMFIKGYAPSGDNAIYYGGGLEVYFGSANYYVDTNFETIEKSVALVIGGNFGYRWRFLPARILNVGISFGPALTIKDDETYVSDGALYQSYEGTTFYALLELSFGWESK